MSANRKWVDPNAVTAKPSSNYFATPDAVFDYFNAKYEFKVDLAANKENKKLTRFIGEAENSLIQEWSKFEGWLWLNPPYSPLKPWIVKAQQEYLKGAQIVMLIPPILNTKYFAEVLPTEIINIVGRIKFIGANGIPMKSNSHDSFIIVYDGKHKTNETKLSWLACPKHVPAPISKADEAKKMDKGET